MILGALLVFLLITASTVWWVLTGTLYISTCMAGHRIETHSQRKNEAWWAEHINCDREDA